MLPGGRIQSTIELVDQFEESVRKGGLPADRLVNHYFRARRYAGSKDKRAISTLFYQIIRNRLQLLEWACHDGDALSGRRLVLTYVALTSYEALKHFTGERYCPKPLTDSEKKYVDSVLQMEPSTKTPVQLNCPDWLYKKFEERFGDDAPEQILSLNDRAPLDLRVYSTRLNRDVALKNICESGLKAEATRFCPHGIRLEQQVPLIDIKFYHAGMCDVQDQAAQIASLLVDAKPGHHVLDMCAGAGGKALAVADEADNKAIINAFDISASKLKEMSKRALRSKIKIADMRRIHDVDTPENRQAMITPFKNKMDRVILDVPCSGTGTWRRNPDQRFKFSQRKLDELTDKQFFLMGEAADLLKVGGRIIYMTCSLLKDENEEKVEQFLKFQEDFKLLDYKTLWHEGWGECPETAADDQNMLLLTPKNHQTDGFFVAILEKCA